MTGATPGPGPLTRAAAGGALWMGGSLGIQIAIGLAAQVVLAAILTPHDFGLFALVVAVAYVLSSVGNFGIRTLLASRTLGELAVLSRPLFRAGLVAATVSGILLVAISPAVASLLDEPELRGLLLVTAITFLLKPYVAVASATLQAQLRFSAVAWSLLLGSTSGYAIAIVMAASGAGAMSLVVNTQVNVAVTAIVLWLAVRREPPPEPSGIAPAVGGLVWWPMAGELAMDAAGRLDFLMLGLFVPTEVVGLYYFAFQLVLRLNELLSGVARNVLFPTLAQIPDRPDRQASGVVRAGAALAFGGGVVAAGLIATMASVEAILWDGRWAAAVPAVMLLATAAPGQAVQSAVEQLLKARARFRRWTAIIAIRAVGSALVALVTGAVLGDRATATAIAVAISAFLVIDAVAEILWIGQGLGVPIGRYLAGSVPRWVLLAAFGWAVAGAVGAWKAGPWASLVVAGGSVLAVSALVGVVAWQRRPAGDQVEKGLGDGAA